MSTWPTVMITGHRPKGLPPTSLSWVEAEVSRVAAKLRDEFGMTDGLSGMALGPDQWWAQSVLDLGLRLHAHVPFPQQPDRWAPHQRDEWLDLLSRATTKVVYGHGFSSEHYRKRNEGLVDQSVQTVGVWVAGKPSGTRNALAYAVRQGRRPIWVDPEMRRTLWPSVESWRAMLTPRTSRRAA